MKDKHINTAVLALAALLIAGLAALRYQLWRAEHPQAKAWTFIIRSR